MSVAGKDGGGRLVRGCEGEWEGVTVCSGVWLESGVGSCFWDREQN